MTFIKKGRNGVVEKIFVEFFLNLIERDKPTGFLWTLQIFEKPSDFFIFDTLISKKKFFLKICSKFLDKKSFLQKLYNKIQLSLLN